MRRLQWAALLLFLPLMAEEFELEELLTRGVSVELRNPTYNDGVLKTQEGGIITAPELRIQAMEITYTRKGEGEERIETIEAGKELMIEFGDYLFTGSRLEYDVTSNTGVIYCGKTAIDPWYFGGEVIELCCDNSFIIRNGFVTTSEGENPDWALLAESVCLSNKRMMNAQNVTLSMLHYRFFRLPKFTMDLSTIFDSPLRYSFRWGGKQGPRARMIYEFFSWYRLHAFARLEYRLNRGPGAGIETYYNSTDHREAMETISYVARDSSICEPHERFRYRFQGHYRKCTNDGKSSLRLCYDKLSDKDMAEDYCDDTLNIAEAGKTELHYRHQECSWISNFVTRLQINNFQTVKQELPSFRVSAHPYELLNSGILAESELSASYLDYDYASDICNVHDYHSTRFELRNSFYRPFQLWGLTVTPGAGFVALHYGNSPQKRPRNMVSGLFGIDANSHFYRYYSQGRHLLEPYLNYRYYTFPNCSPDDHFIFDIGDGWYRLDHLRFGIDNQFFVKGCAPGCVQRLFGFNLFTETFFDTETIPVNFYKLIGTLDWRPNSRLHYTTSAGWNFYVGELDFINYRMEWTLSQNCAVAAEYRHRGRYEWRKVDSNNFIVDSFRSIPELLASTLSDKRDTFLLHTFYRFHPLWALEYQVRHGWNRRGERSYTEMQIDLNTTLGSAWNFIVSYQHKEDDDRIAFYFTLGAKRPNRESCTPQPCIVF